MRASIILIGLGLVLGFPMSARAVEPDVKCYADKVKETAKYSACRLKAESKAIKTVSTPDFSKCDSKYSEKWQKAEIRAEGACPTNADEAVIQARLTGDADAIVTLLGGGSVPECQLPATGQTTCWDSTGLVIPCPGTGQDGDVRAGAALSYVDNGDGTITDLNTGLMWEKKSYDGSIHDFDNIYDFSSAIGVHVATLNSTVFAGYADWRLPNRRELESILDLERSSPAVDPVFHTACAPGCTVLSCSCTAEAPYHSSTTTAWFPEDNWHVDFDTADVLRGRSASEFVRAVRGGL